MMALLDGRMTVKRNSRTIELQRLTDATYYAALVAFGAREAVAMAATRGLITYSTKGK